MMFTDSEIFNNHITKIKETLDKLTNHKIVFEEYIVAPYFGFIILRFNLNDDYVSLDDLDKYERQLYEIVGPDYLVDFMGSTYRKVGVDFSNFSDKLRRLFNVYKNENIEFNAPYKKDIQNDANELLIKVGLNTEEKVWEIQIEDDEINLLILGKENRLIKTIEDQTRINVQEAKEEECTGLVKAIFYAKRNKVSLGRLLY